MNIRPAAIPTANKSIAGIAAHNAIPKNHPRLSFPVMLAKKSPPSSVQRTKRPTQPEFDFVPNGRGFLSVPYKNPKTNTKTMTALVPMGFNE